MQIPEKTLVAGATAPTKQTCFGHKLPVFARIKSKFYSTDAKDCGTFVMVVGCKLVGEWDTLLTLLLEDGTMVTAGLFGLEDFDEYFKVLR